MTEETIALLDLKDLRLDSENPRLPESVGRDQKTMLTYIARTSSIVELMMAIGQHGYFQGEPLIVVPSANHYVVIEGNRRFTALRLLDEPKLLLKNEAIQAAARDAKNKPTQVPCIIFKSRDEIINYLGYRHITGIKQWEPLAKARYVAQYFDTQTSKNLGPDKRYRAVARSIGSQPTFIKRQLDGFAVYRLIEKKRFFSISGLDEENIAFSLLTISLGYDSILKFVSKTDHPYLHRTKIKLPQVKELIRWLFEKDENGETRLGDSRNIQKIALVIEDKDALKAFRDGASLEDAYSKTKGMSDDFAEVLAQASQQLGRAISMIGLVDVDEIHLRRIENIAKQVNALQKFSRD